MRKCLNLLLILVLYISLGFFKTQVSVSFYDCTYGIRNDWITNNTYFLTWCLWWIWISRCAYTFATRCSVQIYINSTLFCFDQRIFAPLVFVVCKNFKLQLVFFFSFQERGMFIDFSTFSSTCGGDGYLLWLWSLANWDVGYMFGWIQYVIFWRCNFLAFHFMLRVYYTFVCNILHV